MSAHSDKWRLLYHERNGERLLDLLPEDCSALGEFLLAVQLDDPRWVKVSSAVQPDGYYRRDDGDFVGYYDPVFDDIKLSIRIGSKSCKRFKPAVEAKKLGAMTDVDAQAFIHQHLKAIAPYIGVGGAIAYQLLDHLLGKHSRKFKEWLKQKERLDAYKIVDIPRYMW